MASNFSPSTYPPLCLSACRKKVFDPFRFFGGRISQFCPNMAANLPRDKLFFLQRSVFNRRSELTTIASSKIIRDEIIHSLKTLYVGERCRAFILRTTLRTLLRSFLPIALIFFSYPLVSRYLLDIANSNLASVHSFAGQLTANLPPLLDTSPSPVYSPFHEEAALYNIDGASPPGLQLTRISSSHPHSHLHTHSNLHPNAHRNLDQHAYPHPHCHPHPRS